MERPRQAWADSTLAERMRLGDPGALAEAYDAYGGLVHGLALRVLGDRRAAGDVTQQVFVSLWEAPDRFDCSRSTLRSLLATMTHRLAVELIRDAGAARATATGAGEPRTGVGAAGDVWAATAGGRPGDAGLRDAVGRLPDAQRRALELTYFQGRTYREVADELGVPAATAKSRLRLGLQGIAESLRGEMSQQWA